MMAEEEEVDRVQAAPKDRRCPCFDDFISRFRAIRQSPRHLAYAYAIGFIDALSYYVFSYALIMHLGEEVGLPDSSAGLFYGLFGVCISAASLICGVLADWLGMRASICISAVIGFVSRLGLAYAVLGRSSWLSALFLFFFVAPSIALIGPPVPTAFKRYTTPRTQDFAFSVYYGVMNIAAFIATPIVDFIRLDSQDRLVLLLPPYALLIAISAVLQIPIFFLSIFGIRDVKLDPDGVTLIPVHDTDVPLNAKKIGFSQRIKAAFQDRNFWRAFVTVACLIGVKSSFRYFDALYLPYVLRAYQDADTFPYLSLLAINPVIVIAATLTGAITILTNQIHPVTSLIIGSAIGGIAPLWMAAGPYLWNIIFYVVFTSVGEVIWSPMAYTFLVSLTTDGSEGTWMSMASLPTFMAKILTGGLTSGLMARFCPDPKLLCPPHPRVADSDSLCHYENGTSTIPTPPAPMIGGDPTRCNGAAIWGIIGCTTITSFILLFVFRRFIKGDDNDKNSRINNSSPEDAILSELRGDGSSPEFANTVEAEEDDDFSLASEKKCETTRK